MILTRRGWALTVAGLALLATGFLFGYAELTVIGTTAIVAVVYAFAHAALRPSLEVTREADPDRVHRGEASTVTLSIRNMSTKFRQLGGAATLIAHDSCGTATVPVPLLRLRRGRVSEVSYQVPTERRGVVRIGPLQVTRRDPLGIVSASRSYGASSKIWVYPRTHLIQAVPTGITRSLDGRVDRVPHGTITFDALREYVIGDELRHVHWRTSARVGELMVREHVDTSLPRLVLLLDDRATSWPGQEPFESACEAAASVVLAAVRESLPITLHLVSGRAASAPARTLLDLLAEAQLTDGDLGTATASLRRHRPGDTLIYLTGTESFSDLSLVTGLRGTFPVVATSVLGPHTKREPEVAGVLSLRAEDGEEFAALWDGVARW